MPKGRMSLGIRYEWQSKVRNKLLMTAKDSPVLVKVVTNILQAFGYV